MASVTGIYRGNLQSEYTHTASGAKLPCGAPPESGGDGNYFSATDLCVTALASCSMNAMARYAQTRGVDIEGTTIEVNKTMQPSPRRIIGIEIIFTMPQREYDAKIKNGLERAVKACPVRRSLNPDIKKAITFRWPD